ncbi:MAG: hypothetical protein R3Y06_04095 [Faecalibacterium sp.]
MDEQYLQVGFEIKLACDALSRRMLRWHWEKTSRPNTLQALMQYVEQRSKETPEYYLNTGVRTGHTTWQQLDTTFCMRVLLDDEVNATDAKHLLRYALREHTARRACNGLRLARNAAAHATEKAAVVKAIALFDETIDDLEDAYGMLLFAPEELAQYDSLIQKATAACVGSKNIQSSKKPAISRKNEPHKAKIPEKKKTTTKSNDRVRENQRRARSSTKKVTASKGTGDPFFREKVFVVLGIMIFFAAVLMQSLQ